MEELKTIIRKAVSLGVKVEFAARIAGMSKSSYYYQPRDGKPGRKPSTHCNKMDGTQVSNEIVVEEIKNCLGQEFMENGYRKTNYLLKDLGYNIGKEKTKRLMKENRLLLAKPKKGKRNFVKQTQPLPSEPFEMLEMDIKFIYIRGEHKNALLLTIIDTFTRIALGWLLQYSIRHSSVIRLFNEVIDQWLQDYRPPVEDKIMVTIRSDNDSRFIANDLQAFLNKNFINQEFILPATPQQNAHIESFHSVVEKLVCEKFDFENFRQTQSTLERFYHTYNYQRTISSILYLPPTVFLNQWQKGNIGVGLRKRRGIIKQKFFFRGQRPKWLSVPAEELSTLGHRKYKYENAIFETVH